MTQKEKLNFAIAKAVIVNQICIEANEDLRNYPQIYRHALKFHCNSLIKELEKRMPECDRAFEETKDYFIYSQQRIEMLIPLISGLRFDELINIADFIEAYKKDAESCREFLSKTLELEIK